MMQKKVEPIEKEQVDLDNSFHDLTKDVLDSYDNIVVYESFPSNFYEVREVKLNSQEKKLAKVFCDILLKKLPFAALKKEFPEISEEYISDVRDNLLDTIEMSNYVDLIPSPEDVIYLKDMLLEIVKKIEFVNSEDTVVDEIIDHSFGYGKLAQLIRDPNLEEIMVNGYNKFLYVFHRKYGMCKTNIFMSKGSVISKLILKIANTVNRKISNNYPLLDARLTDGSRINATVDYVTPDGPTLTIRKFQRVPLSVINLIESGSFSIEVMAFCWVAIEGMGLEPMNMVIAGGAGVGKTTTLNALSEFVRFRERIISIEDTLELDLGERGNLVAMEAKPKTKDVDAVTMDDLLKNALRMRPDRLMIGEVRGPEAETLFVAMGTGHKGSLSTIHANNAREMMLRLKAYPMNVPSDLLTFLDLVMIQNRFYHKDLGLVRRVVQLAEVARMEDQVLLSNVFEWDANSDSIVRTDIPSIVVERISERTGLDKTKISREMLVRQKILEWMMKKGIKGHYDVMNVIQNYYYSPEILLRRINEDYENQE